MGPRTKRPCIRPGSMNIRGLGRETRGYKIDYEVYPGTDPVWLNTRGRGWIHIMF